MLARIDVVCSARPGSRNQVLDGRSLMPRDALDEFAVLHPLETVPEAEEQHCGRDADEHTDQHAKQDIHEI